MYLHNIFAILLLTAIISLPQEAFSKRRNTSINLEYKFIHIPNRVTVHYSGFRLSKGLGKYIGIYYSFYAGVDDDGDAYLHLPLGIFALFALAKENSLPAGKGTEPLGYIFLIPEGFDFHFKVNRSFYITPHFGLGVDIPLRPKRDNEKSKGMIGYEAGIRFNFKPKIGKTYINTGFDMSYYLDLIRNNGGRSGFTSNLFFGFAFE